MNSPFYIFPWDKPFMPPFKNFVEEISGGHPGRAVIITPHLRPARYMKDLFAKGKKACVLPKMMSVNNMITAWRAALSKKSLHVASPLDQAALLYDCVKDLNLDAPMIKSLKSAGSDMGAFLPWGLKLAGILEDLAIQGADIQNFPNMEGELGKAPSIILSSLREISDLWERKLAERQWTTPGQDHKFAAAHAEDIPRLIAPSESQPVFIAGFYILPGAHEILLKSLWEAGARVCLHTDPALAEGRQHWSCDYHYKWAKKWRADIEPVALAPVEGEPAAESDKDEEKYTFFSGFDLHSQLSKMNQLLQEEDFMTTAIIPCKEEELPALAQSLPPVNVNISMGYPMERSPLIRLILSILKMFANSPEDRCFKSSDVLEVIRHPYIHMLKDGEDGASSAASLYGLEREIQKSGLYWSRKGEPSLALGVIDALSQWFSNLSSLDGLGEGIENLCFWLSEKGRDGWKWIYKLDQEVMFRLANNVVPALRNNLLAKTPFTSQTLIKIFMEQVRREAIPFDADSLEGLQIIGLLESRLLQFDRVIVMDASDDALPKRAGQDPLLPDSLRSLLNLPDNKEREAAFAHYLFRLLSGAKKVHFLWREGASGGEFYDGKKTRSRFLEELIYNMEAKKPELLESGGAVEAPRAVLKMTVPKSLSIPAGPELDKAVERFWSNPVGVTSLDAYLACPVQFLNDKIIGLEGGYEEKSPNALAGEYIHKVLKEIYNSLEGALAENLPEGELERLMAEKCQEIKINDMKLDQILPVDEQCALDISVPKILKAYFAKKTDHTECLKHEEDISAEIGLEGKTVVIQGRLDRLDKGADGLYIIDYKTGKTIPKTNPGLWEDADFFDRVSQAIGSGDAEELDACFNQLREKTTSLQLPLYLLALSRIGEKKYGSFPANAALAPLRFAQKEKNLLASPLTGKTDPRLERIRLCLNLLYHHTRLASAFKPKKIDGCERCAYNALCGM